MYNPEPFVTLFAMRWEPPPRSRAREIAGARRAPPALTHARDLASYQAGRKKNVFLTAARLGRYEASLGPRPFSKNGLVQSVWLSPEKWGYRISPDSTRILNRNLSVTRLHSYVFYPCTLVYTWNSNLVPNTSAVYFISTYTNDFTVILRSFSRMRERIAPGRFSSPKKRPGHGCFIADIYVILEHYGTRGTRPLL